MDNLVKRIELFAQQHQLFSSGDCIVVGLSGGPDSVFLLRTLTRLREPHQLTLIATHLDHGWRPESHQDALFCKKLCDNLGVTFVTHRATAEEFAALPAVHQGSQEAQGRIIRRRFFAEVQREFRAATVALAHHADDQKETFFIRLLRGAGLTGLAGIRPREGEFIHPLLCCTKSEILSYLAAHQYTFLTDPTNEEQLFLRNKIRHQVLPALRACDARFDRSLLKAMDNLREADDFIKNVVNKAYEAVVETGNATHRLAIAKFFQQPVFLQKRLLLAWLVAGQVPFVPSQALFDEIIRFLLQTKSPRHLLYDSFYIVKSRGYATLEKKVNRPT